MPRARGSGKPAPAAPAPAPAAAGREESVPAQAAAERGTAAQAAPAAQPAWMSEISDADAPPEEFGAAYAAPPPPAPSLRREEQAEVDALAPENRAKAGAYFRRSLRRNVKSGVLFTMCQDLETAFEGDTFILTTDSDTIFRRLNSADNYKNVQAALAAIGIRSFEIRRKGEQKDPFEAGVEQLRKNFPDADIEVK